MKICLISPDYWNYDQYIVQSLQNKGIDATHICYGRLPYEYPTFFHRVVNFFRKLILKKNIKKEKRQAHIFESLKKIGKQDKILIINPEMISYKNHLEIKKFTDKYICYLYDSLYRNPASRLQEIFDKIFSFDENDVKNHGFQHLDNYIYSEKMPLQKNRKSNYSVYTISSVDERLPLLNAIAHELDRLKITYKFILHDKKEPKNIHPAIEFTKKRLSLEEVKKMQADSEVILDLIRPHQKGLSFRIFEALALQKKIITSNVAIKKYKFYNPSNILIVDAEKPNIDLDFFKTNFVPVPDEIYNLYTLDTWTDRVFDLK